jgi:hypothetical protein
VFVRQSACTDPYTDDANNRLQQPCQEPPNKKKKADSEDCFAPPAASASEGSSDDEDAEDAGPDGSSSDNGEEDDEEEAGDEEEEQQHEEEEDEEEAVDAERSEQEEAASSEEESQENPEEENAQEESEEEEEKEEDKEVDDEVDDRAAAMNTIEGYKAKLATAEAALANMSAKEAESPKNALVVADQKITDALVQAESDKATGDKFTIVKEGDHLNACTHPAAYACYARQDAAHDQGVLVLQLLLEELPLEQLEACKKCRCCKKPYFCFSNQKLQATMKCQVDKK